MVNGTGVYIAGVGMTPMHRRDLTPEELCRQAVDEALADAGLKPADISLALVGNALGGRLNEQGNIRGQAWLRSAGLVHAGIINIDNSCGCGASALHLGTLATMAGEGPVLVLGVEKMWVGRRDQTMLGIEDGVPLNTRAILHATLENASGSVLMGLNAIWTKAQMANRATTPEHFAAAAVKARRHASLNPLAQFREPVTFEEVLGATPIAGPLTRLMCSSFTDGGAAAVLVDRPVPGAPHILASVTQSGDGETDYHERLAEVGRLAWKKAGIGPEDIQAIELHDATSAEEIYALESLGFYEVGEAGPATLEGHTTLGGKDVTVNSSGGLVGRGHPLGATGVAQVVELTKQLRGRAGDRQISGMRLAAAVNTGGIIATVRDGVIVGGDAAFIGMHVLAAG